MSSSEKTFDEMLTANSKAWERTKILRRILKLQNRKKKGLRRIIMIDGKTYSIEVRDSIRTYDKKIRGERL